MSTNQVFTLFLLINLIKVQLSAQPLNNYLVFDGVDDYISLNNMDVTGNSMTIEALVNSSDLSNCANRDCRIISKAVGIENTDHYWMLSSYISGANTVMRFRLQTNGLTTSLEASTGNLSENTWYHVAGSYDGTNMKLYLNGTEVGSTPKSGNISTNPTAGAWIGDNPPNNTDRPWQGAIDDIRIWNVARTQAQIQANKNRELTGTETGLLAYYQFNEGSGQSIIDKAGSNHTVLGRTSLEDTSDPTFGIDNPVTASTELLDVEGAITISNSELSNPKAGTIRWTGQDFEGFTGTEWKSFTACPPNSDSMFPELTCPSQNSISNNCTLTVNWEHDNPLSTTVNYDLKLNGVDQGSAVTYPTTSYTVNLCSALGINSGSGTVDLELIYWYEGNVSAKQSGGICRITYDFDLEGWAAAQADDDYDENLPYSGIFVGAANPGFFGAANSANGRHQSIRFRAEKTGSINAVTIQNRIFTGTTIHTRATNGSAAAPRYQACLDEWASRGNPILNLSNVTENRKANKCGYHIGNFYSAGNGGSLIFQIRHDLNGAPDMVKAPIAQTAVPFIPVDHPNASYPVHVLSSPANVTAGVFYHVTMYNTTPVAGSHVLLPVNQAYDMSDNTGALSLNGVNYAVNPNVEEQAGPFYAGHYTMRSPDMNASSWIKDPNTYGWYGVRYSSGQWSGLVSAAWDVFGAGKQIIEGNRHARQVLTATHTTTVDGIWVQHGHTNYANGQPMTIELKQGSTILGTTSIQHNADVKAAVQSASGIWEEAASAWTYATFDNEVDLIQGSSYYIEASAASGAGFRLNNMGNTYGGSFNQNMQNIPLDTHAERSENGGATWVNYPSSGSFQTNRHLQMVLTVKGMPRSLTD